MATRSTMAARNINGEFISPDVRLTAFGDTSRYTLECTVVNAADLTNPLKSASVFIEWLDETVTPNVWRCGGGTHWLGGSVGSPANAVFSVRSWVKLGDGTVVDQLRGKRVRVRCTTPASNWEGGALFPGTSGTVRLSAAVLDERAT